MSLQPIVKNYRALQVTIEYGVYYLDPTDEQELRAALAHYFTLQGTTKYSHPVKDIKIVELTKQQLYDITTLRFDTPFEQVMERATSSVEKVVDFVRNFTYNVRLNFKEVQTLSIRITELEQKRNQMREYARENLTKFRQGIIATPPAEYEKTFREGVALLNHALFANEYRKLVMELALAVIFHRWGHVQEKELHTVNEEKEKFLCDVVAPLMMGEN